MFPVQDIRETGGASNEITLNDLSTSRSPLPFYGIIPFVEILDACTEFTDAAPSSWRLFVVDLIGLRTEIVTKSPGIVTLCQLKPIK